MSRASLGAVALVIVSVVGPGVASAQLAPTRERVWGVGAGGSIGTEQTSAGTEHTFIQLLNLEVRLPVSPRVELGLHLPLTSMLYANRFDEDVNAFVWGDAFVTWYPMRDAGGLFISPGLGVIYGSTDNSSGVALDIPVRVGWESARPGFGRSLAVRPFFDVVFPSGNVDTGTRYGVVFELTLIGYSTQTASAPVVAGN